MKESTPEKPSCFVANVDVNLAPKLIKDLENQGFEISTPQYTLFSAKADGVSCTLYKSGKLTVQGRKMGAFIEFYLEPEILKDFSYTYGKSESAAPLDLTPRIGIDESGKGDFFGPLCVAGVFAQGEEITKLQKIGVRDSKSLSPKVILELGKKIRNEFVHHILKINPPKYNELISKFHNLNHLLGWGHATVIEQLTTETGCRQAIIDQFASEDVVLNALKRKNIEIELTQRHRGEEDVVVAAASILARCAFVEGIEQLEKQYGQPFPKGASSKTIEAGRAFVRVHGREGMGQVAKLHFKTLDEI